jgi:hypothetical protein
MLIVWSDDTSPCSGDTEITSTPALAAKAIADMANAANGFEIVAIFMNCTKTLLVIVKRFYV